MGPARALFLLLISAVVPITQAQPNASIKNALKSCQGGDKAACRQAIRLADGEAGAAGSLHRLEAMDQLCKHDDSANCQALLAYYTQQNPDEGKQKLYSDILRRQGFAIAPKSHPKPEGSEDVENSKTPGPDRKASPAPLPVNPKCVNKDKKPKPLSPDLFARRASDPSDCRGPCPQFSFTQAKELISATQANDLHVIAVATSAGPEIKVNIDEGTRDISLLLASDRKVVWRIQGRALSKVKQVYIVSNQNSSTLGLPAGVSVTNLGNRQDFSPDPNSPQFFAFINYARLSAAGLEASYQGAIQGGEFTVPYARNPVLAASRQRDFATRMGLMQIERTPLLVALLKITAEMPRASFWQDGAITKWDGNGISLPDRTKLNGPAAAPGQASALTFDSSRNRYCMLAPSEKRPLFVYTPSTKEWKDKPMRRRKLTGLAYNSATDEIWSLDDSNDSAQKNVTRFEIFAGDFTWKRNVDLKGRPLQRSNNGSYDVQLLFLEGKLILWKNDHSQTFVVDPECGLIEPASM